MTFQRFPQLTALPRIIEDASDDWWASLKHGGLLIAPSKLNEFFVVESLEPLPYWVEERLRQGVTRLQNGEDEHLSTFLDTLLEAVLGLMGDWQKGRQVDSLQSEQASGLSPLMAAIDASRQGQGEISEVLGERGRQAVELLIRESAESLIKFGNWKTGIGNRQSNPHDSRLTTSRLPIHYQYRFLLWQLAGTPEESWEECDRHAENLRRLLGTKSSSSSTPDSQLPPLTHSLLPNN